MTLYHDQGHSPRGRIARGAFIDARMPGLSHGIRGASAFLWIALWTLIVAGGHASAVRGADPEPQFKGIEHARKTIYHSPEKPGYTCWVGAWIMPDKSLMVCFTQATGPLKDRARAPAEVRRKLDWPPHNNENYDMTGLDLRNVHLRSMDDGATWKQVSADPFRSPMNGVTGECATALPDGTVLRGVFGFYLPYDADVPKTGFIQRSTDGTATWGKPETLLDPGKFMCWPRRLRVLKDGRLLLTGGLVRASGEDKNREKFAPLVEPLLMISGDGGKSWTGPLDAIPSDQRTSWTEEWDFAELDGGDLFCVFRRPDPDTKAHTRWQGLLKKDGARWTLTDLRPAPFPHTGHPELLRTQEGPILHIASNSIDATSDAGKSWQKLAIPGSAYYPRSVQAADGRIFVFSHIGSDDPYGGRDQSIVMDTFRLSK